MKTRLEELMAESDHLTLQQREGLVLVRSGAEQKEKLCRTMKVRHLAYLSRVGKAVAHEDPELGEKLTLRRGSRAYLTFRVAAGAMLQEALSHPELLERHGLAGTVLEELTQLLADFDFAVEELIAGRRAHIGASVGLQRIADEIVRLTDLMEGFNRVRFAHDAEAWAAWASASKVLSGPVRHDQGPPGEGDAA